LEDELPQLDIVNIQQTPKPKIKDGKAKLIQVGMIENCRIGV
jgi:hypothetical protein